MVDDRNMPGKTLGVRRIQCGRRDLVPLKKAVFNIPQLLRSNKKFFIDTAGKPFIYQKTYSSRLKCYKITKVHKKETASILHLHGVNSPFTVDAPPPAEAKFARLLHMGNLPWLLYDYVPLVTKETYRRV